ncbi:hypothetical protein EYC80_000942 [Monilinia laxa]|uniref:Uncharacterized protein n=1 Tax=Monilinia laxa TaxID=61186 RepID=A0A5N6K7M8_MONLA|nr:hypothetical protein EYC80_000942 [Monilinia laxa]
MLLNGLMRMQARAAHDDLEARDLALMNEGEGLSEDELQQRALGDADTEAREMARLCRVYLGRMMALRISSRDLPEPEL